MNADSAGKRRAARAGLRNSPARAASPKPTYSGSFRKIGRGTWRSPDITYRNAPGAHTVCEPRRRPVMIASATASGGGGQRGLLHALRHLRVDEAGPDHHHVHAGADQAVAEALGEGVEAGLAGAVDEVRRGGRARRPPRTAPPGRRGPASSAPARPRCRWRPRRCSSRARPPRRGPGPSRPRPGRRARRRPSAPRRCRRRRRPGTATLSWSSVAAASKATTSTVAPSLRSSAALSSRRWEGRPAR